MIDDDNESWEVKKVVRILFCWLVCASPFGWRRCDVIKISWRNATTAASEMGFFMVFTAQGAPCNDPLKTLSGERKRTSCCRVRMSQLNGLGIGVTLLSERPRADFLHELHVFRRQQHLLQHLLLPLRPTPRLGSLVFHTAAFL